MKKNPKLFHADLSGVNKFKLQKGVVLLEALIAILIFSIGILAIVGLQAAMIKNTSDNKYRSDASFIAQERIGQMWADPNNVANYFETDTSIADVLPNGTRTVVAEPTGRGLVTVTVTWQAPGGDQHQYTISTYIGAS
jgi:type IV pilus assembly protein PilV